jgi:hypothetical protein
MTDQRMTFGQFEIEACEIPQTRDSSKTEWFVDHISLRDGRKARRNLRSFNTYADAAAFARQMAARI